MLAAITLSALVGNWICTTPDWPHNPRNRYAYAFASDGRGSFVQFSGDHGTAPLTFTYRIANGYVIVRTPTYTMRHRFVLPLRGFGRILEDDGYVYWHSGRWTAPSSQDRYTCTRGR